MRSVAVKAVGWVYVDGEQLGPWQVGCSQQARRLGKEAAMPQVLYVGNGSDGGLVPVDSNTYAPGGTVNVADNTPGQAPTEQKDSHGNPENIVTGDLSRTGAVYLYW